GDLHDWRHHLWIRGDGERGDRDEPDNDDDNRDHDRENRAVDEKLRHYFCRCGFTVAPGRTFCRPSTMTRSPGFNPCVTMTRSPTRSPGTMLRAWTLFSGPTVNTDCNPCKSCTAR